MHGRFAAGSPTREGTADAPDRTSATPFFFYPANAWQHKNHEVLLLAYGMYRAGAQAAGQVPWPLVLTGHEDERWAQLHALAGTLDLLGEDAVRFVGYVPAADFGQLWETAGALVFPSLHEGFGIPLLEAMEHGVPVLCSREGSLPEVGADACYFVDARRPAALAEGMIRLAADASLRQSLVRAGRRRLEDFSQDREAGRLLDVIVALAQTSPPYRPFTQGIYPDGWMEGSALLALPGSPEDGSVKGRLTLRLRPLPEPRRVRLWAGRKAALGSFGLQVYQTGQEITVDFRPAGGALTLEVPDAANLNAADGRVHGVCLLSADLRLEDGREFPLFSAP